MTRADVALRLAELEGMLSAEVDLAQTRDQHVRASRVLAELRRLQADLAAVPAA